MVATGLVGGHRRPRFAQVVEDSDLGGGQWLQVWVAGYCAAHKARL